MEGLLLRIPFPRVLPEPQSVPKTILLRTPPDSQLSHCNSANCSQTSSSASSGWPACILGLGSAIPPPKQQYSQQQLAQALMDRFPNERSFVETCKETSKVESRGMSTSLEILSAGAAMGGASEELKQHIEEALQDMLLTAALDALNEWGGDVSDITHVIYGTSNGGCYAPSHEVALIERLKLNNTVQRVSFDHMHSLGAHRVLSLASETACASTSHRVLVVFGDMGSLLSCFMPVQPSRQDISNAMLCADGAAAAVVGVAPRPGERSLFEVHFCKSLVTVADSEHPTNMATAADAGTIPSSASEWVVCRIKAFAEQLAHECGVRLPECAVLCEPSTAQVLNAVEQELGLSAQQMEASRQVLRKHGYMQGTTNLFLVDEYRRWSRTSMFDWVMGVSYCPVLGLEGVMLRRVGAGSSPTPCHFMPDVGPPCVLSLASAWPPDEFQHSQQDILEALLTQTDLSSEDRSFAKAVYEGTMVDRRGLALPLQELYTRPESAAAEHAQRMQVHQVMFDFFVAAAERALLEWGGERSKITHLLVGSLTFVPGPNCDLAKRLNLSTGVKRVHIDHMGCLAGFRTLGLASQIAVASPQHRVLMIYGDVSVLLGTHLPDRPNKLDLVSVSLFADGAAAAVVGSSPLEHEQAVYEVLDVKSQLMANSRKDMYMYVLGDGSVTNLVSPRVPIFIGKGVKGFVDRILERSGISMQECAMLCHPGGKTILETVQEKLGISREQIQSSWDVLKLHGNMSGATNLQVADHYRRSKESLKYPWAVCVSFGPGLGMEGLLLHVCTPRSLSSRQRISTPSLRIKNPGSVRVQPEATLPCGSSPDSSDSTSIHSSRFVIGGGKAIHTQLWYTLSSWKFPLVLALFNLLFAVLLMAVITRL